MSLVAYVGGTLIADRNCEEWSMGVILNNTPMKKISISKCGSLALAHCGDYVEPERLDYLMNLLIAKLRSHEMENTESVFLSTIEIQAADEFFNLENNSWYVMTCDNAYKMTANALLPLTPEQVIVSGTLGTPFHTYVMNGFDPQTAIERTLRVMPCAVMEYDVVKHTDLTPLGVSMGSALVILEVIEQLKQAKE